MWVCLKCDVGMPQMRKRIQKSKSGTLLRKSAQNSIRIYLFAATGSTPASAKNDGCIAG